LHKSVERIVALHQVDDVQQAMGAGVISQFFRFPGLQRGRFFADHVFAGFQGLFRLRIVQPGRRSNIYQLNAVVGQQSGIIGFYFGLHVLRQGCCRCGIQVRDGDDAYAGNFQKGFGGKISETAGTQNTDVESVLHRVKINRRFSPVRIKESGQRANFR